jgi:hypothetical protein
MAAPNVRDIEQGRAALGAAIVARAEETAAFKGKEPKMQGKFWLESALQYMEACNQAQVPQVFSFLINQ